MMGTGFPIRRSVSLSQWFVHPGEGDWGHSDDDDALALHCILVYENP